MDYYSPWVSKKSQSAWRIRSSTGWWSVHVSVHSICLELIVKVWWSYWLLLSQLQEEKQYISIWIRLKLKVCANGLTCTIFPSLPPATRDAISKAVYDRLFRWIVNQINHLLAPTLEEIAWSYDIGVCVFCVAVSVNCVLSLSVGILDIFGFEDFTKNSFEQLCINLANEQLHNFFIQVH